MYFRKSSRKLIKKKRRRRKKKQSKKKLKKEDRLITMPLIQHSLVISQKSNSPTKKLSHFHQLGARLKRDESVKKSEKD